VTAQAQWRSSDSSVVTISADGVAHAASPGDAQISAIYLGTSSFERVRVLSGQPPLPLFEIGSRVVASPTCGPNDGVPGVIVTVASGLNVGRSATTGNGGSYTIPDVVYGAISLHASRDGYQDAIVTGAVGYSPGAATPSGFILRSYSHCVIHCRWRGVDISDTPTSVHVLLVLAGTPVPKSAADIAAMNMRAWASCVVSRDNGT
jgi:hypothetical protein